ncbi:hypothetical protein [Actibacterium sp.]|uniref:hypothetical protein n=1 Tax=Actibacterium sp. TaxID=1872125 RepID=UPI0025810979|nr:hypothetical protein [Actibacterium sp.]|tara:strand:- start:10390 stop:10647 length:258 start_codon:yes stop_codon:yes gene_type:complete
MIFDNRAKRVAMDLSRFDAASLIAFTATKETNYGTETVNEFRQDAVRIALTSGPAHKQMAALKRDRSSSRLLTRVPNHLTTDSYA